MAKSSVLVNLPQLVDVALNCNEGIINFQALHTLLHVTIQQMSLTNVGVEFRGPEGEKIQSLITTMKSGTNLYPEYSIVGQKGRRAKHLGSKKISLQDVIREREKSDEIKLKEEEIRTIERRRDSKSDPDSNPPSLKSPQGSLLGFKTADVKTVVVVDAQSTLPQFTVTVSKDKFDTLHNDIEVVKDQIRELRELPANLGLLEAVKSPSAPIVDMFQILNLTKRMESSEQAMMKISSLIEDLAKFDSRDDISAMQLEEKMQEMKGEVASLGTDRRSSSQGNRKGSETKRDSVGSKSSHSSSAHNKKMLFKLVSLEKRISTLEDNLKDLNLGDFEYNAAPKEEVGESAREDASKQEEQRKEDSTVKEDAAAKDQVTGDSGKEKDDASTAVKPTGSVEASIASQVPLPRPVKKSMGKPETIKVMTPHRAFDPIVSKIDFSDMSTEDALMLIQQEFENLQKWTAGSLQEVDKRVFQSGGLGGMDVKNIELKFSEYGDKFKELNKMYNQQMTLLNNQYERVEADMNDIYTKLEIVLPGGDSTGVNAETTLELASKLDMLQQEMAAITDNTAKLEDEKREQDKQTEAILEQIDVLKIVKANREDLEDALGEKADACMINRKVSHDQFDAACDDLTRGIEEALSKLEAQEELWRQALDSLHKEVGSKLDKMEVDPLRDFVNSKLKALQDKFKALTNLKKEHEAAGTKSKYLRDVNCISCDRDVVMRKEMDMSLKPKAYAMPPRRNIAPYLAYELDQLRKQQKCAPGSKNLNFIESAMKTRGHKEKDHICNRYCGGSHTTTTPQQRVTRLGHFLDQWGPEIAPLSDELVKGRDNHMYKSRDDSIYKKSKQGIKTSAKTNKEMPVPESEVPQHDREIYINRQAETAISTEGTQEEKEEENSDAKKKIHNIGALASQGDSRRTGENSRQESARSSKDAQNN